MKNPKKSNFPGKVGNLLASFLLLVHYTCTGCQPSAPPHPEVGTVTQANSDGYNYKKDGKRTTDFIYNQL